MFYLAVVAIIFFLGVGVFAGYLTWYSSQSTKRIYEFKVGVLRAKGVPESEIAKHLKSDANGEHIAHTNS